MSAPTCSAPGLDGPCGRASAAHNLCSGHYAQHRRGKPFTALKAAHGATGLVKLTIMVPAADLEAIAQDAVRRGVKPSVAARDALSRGLHTTPTESP